ncbi:MAG: hypothetical protein GPJ54_18810 [Candidatus Heimdallarchaeota archaeon]|nr:hypothetical protein [Candidatus Heimdallarchaeota archaeon]
MFSLFTTFKTSEKLSKVFSKLSEEGKVWILLFNHPDGKFGMIKDKFGFQWMLNWSKYLV